ncbi:hypothetical protein D9611_007048 [Ephemerocybe angulata]|uniref:Uncharacterized protein n=1 Tax=Ephemerocybe angulata TaxID=980116 RepID=A0A8H5EWA9_9AGAR|nr:hypothetical protein D9611_007048 [Tulosesus angulatus]
MDATFRALLIALLFFSGRKSCYVVAIPAPQPSFIPLVIDLNQPPVLHAAADLLRQGRLRPPAEIFSALAHDASGTAPGPLVSGDVHQFLLPAPSPAQQLQRPPLDQVLSLLYQQQQATPSQQLQALPAEQGEAHFPAPEQQQYQPLPSFPTIPATLPFQPIPSEALSQLSFASLTPTESSTGAADPSAAATTASPSPLDSDSDNASGSSKSKKASVFPVIAIVVGSLAAISLCIFMLLDPRVSRGCRRQRIKSKGIGNRPISSWFPFPGQSPGSGVARKPVSGEESFCSPHTPRGLELEMSEHGGSLASSYPRSKFSITSSDYSQISRSAGMDDAILIENTRANESIPPIRPPRPPMADSPATISDSVFFAAEYQIYTNKALIFGEQDDETSSMNTVVDTRNVRISPLLPPETFFTMNSMSTSSTCTVGLAASPGDTVNAGGGNQSPRVTWVPADRLLTTRPETGQRQDLSETLLPGDESRHSRTHSAPIFMGNPVDESYHPIYMDPVAKKVMQHRRSRSNSGWAYPRREERLASDDESYNGVLGEAL